MTQYRFYMASQIELSWVPTTVACSSDAEAFIIAARMASAMMGAEAWDGSRLVCRVPANCRSEMGAGVGGRRNLAAERRLQGAEHRR